MRRCTRAPLAAFALAHVAAACGGGSDGAAGPAAPPPSRDVQVGAVDHAFTGVEGVQVRAGETVRFVLRNTGAAVHELQVLDAGSSKVGAVPRVAPGEEGSGVATFAAAGRYRLICDVDDHLVRGMRAVVTAT